MFPYNLLSTSYEEKSRTNLNYFTLYQLDFLCDPCDTLVRLNTVCFVVASEENLSRITDYQLQEENWLLIRSALHYTKEISLCVKLYEPP
jgi:hypothetical protein